MECYFGIVGVYFEPSYSRCRIILAMVAAIVTILDDIYDVYGNSEECELFTKAIERYVFFFFYRRKVCIFHFNKGQLFL